MRTVDRIERCADALGVSIVHHAGPPKGYYIPDRHAISIQADLHPIQEVCTVAHELGHAVHCHRPGPLRRARREREADTFAVAILLRPAEVERAVRAHPCDLAAVADELGVTVHLAQVAVNLWGPATSACAK